jgi:hypothetical protein
MTAGSVDGVDLHTAGTDHGQAEQIISRIAVFRTQAHHEVHTLVASAVVASAFAVDERPHCLADLRGGDAKVTGAGAVDLDFDTWLALFDGAVHVCRAGDRLQPGRMPCRGRADRCPAS